MIRDFHESRRFYQDIALLVPAKAEMFRQSKARGQQNRLPKRQPSHSAQKLVKRTHKEVSGIWAHAADVEKLH